MKCLGLSARAMRRLLLGLSVALPGAAQAVDNPPIGVQWIQHINGSAIRLTADGWEAGIRSQAREPDRLWLQPDARVRDVSDLSLAGDFAWRDDSLSVVSRIDYHSLAPRPAFNHRKRQDASLQTSVQRRFGVWRVAVDWQQFGEDYALPTDIWFAGDRERRALRVERPWAGGQINLGLAEQVQQRSKPQRTRTQRRWVGWHGIRRGGRSLRVELEHLDRAPAGVAVGWRQQTETRLRLGMGQQLGRVLLNLNTEWFHQQTRRHQTRSLTRAGIVNLSAELPWRRLRLRAWTTASNYDLAAGHNMAVHAGVQAIADTLWSDVHLEVGVDRAYRDQVWAQASVTESHANGRLRWTPRHLGGYFSPSARPSLELVADLRERRSGGDAELADPTLMLIWTVR
ncbi:hypothetical protein [Abyssibacter profundi]|nr:hypothetical protein [Abyssibacter profundi]